jgi:hypothetical protein
VNVKHIHCASQRFLLKLVLRNKMEPNKQNDDVTRLRKRTTAIEAVKRTPAYIIANLYDSDRSLTPDPNEKISKRQWEKSMMMWRAELRETFRELSAPKILT